MIGLDLDGVLVTDLNIDYFKEIDTFLEYRCNAFRKNFEPRFDYCIITGRPSIDKEYTLRWIDKNLKNKPKEIFHDNQDFTKSSVYKAAVLNAREDIKMFVESSRSQVNEIKNMLTRDVPVFVFEDLINGAIHEKIRNI